MSGFKALNIESDDESDVEVDDTKEIQIEEALKLYQTALKFHAEGPDSFKKAATAYQQLFESEIFKYPESQTELQRIELYGPSPDTYELWDDNLPGAGPVSGNLDIGPSTLPQILHLSHKNYAQFKLDALSAKFNTFNVTLNQILADATVALNNFVKALDKDDSDLDLWRRTASVGEMLDSRRVARYCLESVLDGDDEGFNGMISLPGLEEGFAGEQLRELVGQFQDQLSLLQAPLSTAKRRKLSKVLKKQLHPYDDILRREAPLLEQSRETAKTITPTSERNVLAAPTTWADLGDVILRQLLAEQHGNPAVSAGAAISFDLSEAFAESPLAIEASSSENPLDVIERVEFQAPETITDQFPGLDAGRPTAQPQIASADPSMQVAWASSTDDDIDMINSPTMTLPSRKRSGDAAGLNDGADEGRMKSRRTRARESNIDAADNRQAMIDANARWEYEQQINEFQAADDWMFETVGNLFEKANIAGFDAARHVRQEMASSTESSPSARPNHAMHGLKIARSEIQTFLDKYNEQQAHLLLHGGESLDLGSGTPGTGTGGMFTGGGTSKALNKAPQLPNDGLLDLLQSINQGFDLTQDVAWKFIETLLRPGSLSDASNSYADFLWPENLKTMAVRTLVNFDDCIYEKAVAQLEDWKSALERGAHADHFYSLAELAQSIYELHLDIYSLIKQPNSGVESEIVFAQCDRLQRWSDVTREFMHCRVTVDGTADLNDQLSLRFLWATTFHLSVSSDVSQDHVIECMTDLRAVFVAANDPIIQLQNNAIMPELSVSTLDREISKLTTKDFFLKVTNQDLHDPAGVIESLEPLLEAIEPAIETESDEAEGEPPRVPNVAPELVRFMENSSLSIRLLLWQRLRDAYLGIEYKPMVVRCNLRMIRMVLDHLKSDEVANLAQAERQTMVLKCLRLVQNIIKRLFEILQSSKEALECIDEPGLKLAVQNFGEVLQLIQVFNVAEDSIRVGQSQPPTQSNGLPVTSWRTVTTLVHEMQVHIWMILYRFLKEAISQNSEQYKTPLEDQFDFLRTVHRNLGIRNICGVLNRAFIRLLKDEFFQMTHIDGYDSEQAQVLYDLYRLNCFLNPSYELIEHNCTSDAFLDRGVALQAVDLLLAQAAKLPIRDLVKHPLRETIDKVHGALPRKKPTEDILRNREVYRAFLRSPISPLDLFNCLKGEGNQLPVLSIPRDDVVLASKGWHFLMGHMALTKFRSQKRTGPTPTEEVDIAIAFFMQDLEYTDAKWETWFRLAQAYDTKIEEGVVWSAERLNSMMPELVTLQRQAIHCYIMATALAHRSADLDFETSSKMTELHYDFANRIYASARKPFDMQAFNVDDIERFVSVSTGVKRDKAFVGLRVYTAVKLANVLFQRALPGKPDNWMIHHMIGKCLWKMHASPEGLRPRDQPPSATLVLQAYVRALELLPDKDKKGDKKEPVLEPHYKIVSVVHKLLNQTRTITLQQAKEALDNIHYARKEPFPNSMEGWVPYVLAVLKHLRAADKSNWYHRMIARSAQIIWNQNPNTDAGAMGAKQELTQQMFTKTMVLQVWKPESERPGRHFVYTARYTRFFVDILKQLKDRQGLEQLARRVRRRPHDVFEHASVWQDICNAYLQLLRNHANLAEGLETSTFSNIAHEDFLNRKEPLEKWMQVQEAGTVPALDVLREVQELKKINQGLMKPGAIDDLIGDSYAQLFNSVGKHLWEEERRLKHEEEARREAEKPPAIASPARNPMMSLTHLMNLDGSNDGPSKPEQAAPIVAPAVEAAPARRKVGVGRREIRNCAESCFQKTKPQSQPTEQAIQKAIANAPRVQLLIERERHTIPGDASVETSAPGSVHDDADDESELSELEEVDDETDVVRPEDKAGDAPRPLYPNLTTINSASRDEEEEFETAEEGTGPEQEDVEMTDEAAVPADGTQNE